MTGTTASSMTADQYDELASSIYLEPANVEALNDLSVISGSKQSPGGPRAGTSKVEAVGKSDTGGFAFYQPSQGEVWLLEEITVEAVTSGTWTIAVELDVDGVGMTIIPTSSKTDTFLLFSQTYGWPTANFYLDENTKVNITLGGSFSSISIKALMTRYR
jgi:hypothetical protein